MRLSKSGLVCLYSPHNLFCLIAYVKTTSRISGVTFGKDCLGAAFLMHLVTHSFESLFGYKIQDYRFYKKHLSAVPLLASSVARKKTSCLTYPPIYW